MHQRKNITSNLCSVKVEKDYQGKVFITIKNNSTSPILVRICHKDDGGGALPIIKVPAQRRVREHIVNWECGQFLNKQGRAGFPSGLIYCVERNGEQIKEGDIGTEIMK